jgi:formylmethanofuran dehydrogenase subunit E
MKITCEVCKKEFDRDSSEAERYDFFLCSESCLSVHEFRVAVSHKKQSKKIKMHCLYCGEPIYVYRYEVEDGGGKYCSMACSYEGIENRGIDI